LAAVAAAAAAGSDLPWAGKSAGVPLMVECFVGSVARLAWAKANHVPWNKNICGLAADGGHLETLKWARGRNCPWGVMTCANAAAGGHLEVLKWARELQCPWDEETCYRAAEGGHLEVLKWAHAHRCPCNLYFSRENVCACR